MIKFGSFESNFLSIYSDYCTKHIRTFITHLLLHAMRSVSGGYEKSSPGFRLFLLLASLFSPFWPFSFSNEHKKFLLPTASEESKQLRVARFTGLQRETPRGKKKKKKLQEAKNKEKMMKKKRDSSGRKEEGKRRTAT